MNDGISSSTFTKSTILRCAIYTRVSTDHGLDQDFNSLDAQREACEAFIKSQANEGWRLDPTTYDDGGFSGGTTQRPALQHLLDAIKANQIDIIVVYKVDRLTRSLADFAKLVELFDHHGVSFVSVTQAFNTTNSMGRLTLNVLLSFAQFEREVTGERIRDKIAASKKKGMRMGGPVPLGYVLQDKKLIPHETEAEAIRLIFNRYLELGSISLTVQDLENKNIKTKASFRKDGSQRGGIAFTKGPLAFLLRNRVYIGEIIHKGQHYKGEHEPIVPRDLFEAVQQQLSRAKNTEARYRLNDNALLKGILFNAEGALMHPVATKKGPARYRYYQAPNKGKSLIDGSQIITRISAYSIENAVKEFIELQPLKSTNYQNKSLEIDQSHRSLVKEQIKQIIVHHDHIAIELINTVPTSLNEGKIDQIYKIPHKAKIRNQTKFIFLNHASAEPINSTQIRSETRARFIINIAKASLWLDEIIQGKIEDTNAIAKREKISEKTARNILSLIFLSSKEIKSITL